MSKITNKEGKQIPTDMWINENHPENGVFKVYWSKNGGVSLKDEGFGQRYEWIYKDGKRGDGPSKGWYPNGQIKQIWNWTNGYKDGLFRFWYENGQIFYTGMFVNGKKDGKWTWWYEDGTKEMEKIYKKGRPDGVWRWWNESGELMKSGEYVNGMKQGMWNYYYDKGQKYFEDIERQIREGGGHWQWIDDSYGADDESGKGGERDVTKPFITPPKKWRPRVERTN